MYSRALGIFSLGRVAADLCLLIEPADWVEWTRIGWEWVIALLMPFVIVRTLLLDSQYWSGLATGPAVGSGVVSIRTPLLGTGLHLGLSRETAGSFLRLVPGGV